MHAYHTVTMLFSTRSCHYFGCDGQGCELESSIRREQRKQLCLFSSLALSTIAWLGEGVDQLEDERAHYTLRCLISHQKFHRDHEPVPLANGLTTCDVVGEFWSCGGPSSTIQMSADVLLPALRLGELVRRFIKRRYFSRRWVVQETFHAKLAGMLWCGKMISLSDLSASFCFAVALMTNVERSAKSKVPKSLEYGNLLHKIARLIKWLFKRCNGIINVFVARNMTSTLEDNRVPIL